MTSSTNTLLWLVAIVTVVTGLAPSSNGLGGVRTDKFPGSPGECHGDCTAPGLKATIPRRSLRYRLVNGVRPIHYDIKLRPVFEQLPSPDFELLKTPGEVTITLECVNATSTIQLNILDINITESEVSLREISGDIVPISQHGYDEIKEQYIIQLGRELTPANTYQLVVPYIGKIYDNERYGLYLSSYLDDEGNFRYLVSTQLEPTNARRLYPSFDEPDLKATFQVTIGRHSAWGTLSNTELNNTSADPDYAEWLWDTYNPTLRMSTYLVALTVAKFKPEVADASIYDKPVTIWAVESIIDRGSAKYPAMSIANSLALFDSLFDVKYGLPKMDSAAVPLFSGGAMENWGLNIYGYDFMLYTPGETPEANRQLVTLVTGHEIAHQWFGNLVTCKWWSDIWLNEGFARHLQYWPMRVTAPEFEPDISQISDMQAALVYDQSTLSHPVKNNASTPVEIDEVFDPISYDKGASLMRMLEAILTTSNYLAGVNLYLQRMQYLGAVQDNLFEALQETGGQLLPVSVKEIMETWTFQAGFPLVRVYAEDASAIRLTQEEFRSVPAGYNKTWWIPIKVVSASSPDIGDSKVDYWMPNTETSVTISTGMDTTQWTVINPDLIGFYRVWYEPAMLKLITDQLLVDHTVFTPITRSMLLEDYFNYFFEGEDSFDQLLQIAGYLRKETHAAVWLPFASNFLLALTLQPCRSNGTFCIDYLIDKVDGTLNEIGWEQPADEVGLTTVLRERLLQIACRYNHPNCTNYMNRLFDQWLETPDNRSLIPVDLRSLASCVGVATHSKSKGLSRVLEVYNTTKNKDTKRQIRRALGCASKLDLSNPTLLEVLLEPQYINDVLPYVAKYNPQGNDFVISAMVSRFNMLRSKDIVSILKALDYNGISNDDFHLLEDFFRDHHDELNSSSMMTVKKSMQMLSRHVRISMKLE